MGTSQKNMFSLFLDYELNRNAVKRYFKKSAKFTDYIQMKMMVLRFLAR